MKPKIDIVFTWVNGNQNEFLLNLQKNTNNPENLDPKRYRDSLETLKYSLRSIEKYAPWYNHIFIVTQRPQRPHWLIESHPRLTLIYHDEFIPAEYLPTFNPRVIQSFFHKITGIEEYFLYMNDDYLFRNTIKKEDFFSSSGRIKVYGSLVGIPLRFRIYAQKGQIKGMPRLEHSPFLIVKSYWEKMLKILPKEIENTRRSPFRKPENIRMDRLYRFFLLRYKRKRIDVMWFYELLQISFFLRITEDKDHVTAQLNQVEEKQPKFICLNDNQGDQENSTINTIMEKYLKNVYSLKSEFEQTESY